MKNRVLLVPLLISTAFFVALSVRGAMMPQNSQDVLEACVLDYIHHLPAHTPITVGLNLRSERNAELVFPAALLGKLRREHRGVRFLDGWPFSVPPSHFLVLEPPRFKNSLFATCVLRGENGTRRGQLPQPLHQRFVLARSPLNPFDNRWRVAKIEDVP